MPLLSKSRFRLPPVSAAALARVRLREARRAAEMDAITAVQDDIARLLQRDIASTAIFESLALTDAPAEPVLPNLNLRSSLRTWRSHSRSRSMRRPPLSPVANEQRAVGSATRGKGAASGGGGASGGGDGGDGRLCSPRFCARRGRCEAQVT